MPRARNIKPGFFKNDQLADTSAHCRLLFIGLWTLADRDGRLEYRPRRIKGELFPYEDIDVDYEACHLQSLNFVKIYEVSGTLYLQILNFQKHQKPHPNEKSEGLPAPEDATSTREMVRNDRASSLNDDRGCDDSLNEDSAPSDESLDAGATPVLASRTSQDDPVVESIPLNDGSEYPVTESQASEYARLYPAVDVPQELRKMRGWSMGNKPKRKTRRGIEKFIHTWLSKAQDSGGSPAGGPPSRGSYGPRAVDNSGAAAEAKRRFRERQQQGVVYDH